MADGLQLMHALTGDNDLTQDLPAARAAANARDERLLANMNLPESLAKSVETARASDGHDIEMRIAQPKGEGKKPLFFWIHGGGYVLGQAKQGDVFCSRAAALGCYAASVEYRLAPETAYPGPLEDCYEGLAHLLAHADALGIDANKVIIMGMPVAAGRSVFADTRSRLCSPMGQVPIYPMIDDTNSTRFDALPDTHWSRHYNRLVGKFSRFTEAMRCRFIQSGARDDLSAPPTYMPVGDLDLFLPRYCLYQN